MLKIIVWLALIIPVLANLLSYRSLYDLNNSSSIVNHIQGVLDSLDALNLNLIASESELQSYIITSEKKYLFNYRKYNDKTFKELNVFIELTETDTPNDPKYVKLLKILIFERFTLLEKSSISKKISEEKNLTNKIIGLIADKKKSEEALLKENIQKERVNSISTLIKSSVGDFLGLFLLLYAIYRLNQEYKTRKRAEKDLKESEENFRSYFNYAALGMAMVSMDGKFIKVNSALCKITGYTEDEILNKSLEDLIHNEDFLIDIELTKQLLNNEISSYQIEKRLITINEDIIICLFSISVVISSEKKPLYFVMQIQDITQRKQIEEDLENKNNELERSNTSLIEFSYVVSHDMKEPLSSIIKNLEILKEDLNKVEAEKESKEKTDQFVNDIISSAYRMKTFISELLIYSMAGIHGELNFNDSNKVLDQVIKNLSSAISQSNASVTYDSLPNIEADPLRLEQLFQNLVMNAIKYNKNPNPQIHISVKFKNHKFIFSVKDNGIGIKNDDKERIFGLFSRLTSQKEFSGTGIGLAVCKKIVEYYNGKIWVDSEIGKGSTFYFTLPGKN